MQVTIFKDIGDLLEKEETQTVGMKSKLEFKIMTLLVIYRADRVVI